MSVTNFRPLPPGKVFVESLTRRWKAKHYQPDQTLPRIPLRMHVMQKVCATAISLLDAPHATKDAIRSALIPFAGLAVSKTQNEHDRTIDFDSITTHAQEIEYANPASATVTFDGIECSKTKTRMLSMTGKEFYIAELRSKNGTFNGITIPMLAGIGNSAEGFFHNNLIPFLLGLGCHIILIDQPGIAKNLHYETEKPRVMALVDEILPVVCKYLADEKYNVHWVAYSQGGMTFKIFKAKFEKCIHENPRFTDTVKSSNCLGSPYLILANAHPLYAMILGLSELLKHSSSLRKWLPAVPYQKLLKIIGDEWYKIDFNSLLIGNHWGLSLISSEKNPSFNEAQSADCMKNGFKPIPTKELLWYVERSRLGSLPYLDKGLATVAADQLDVDISGVEDPLSRAHTLDYMYDLTKYSSSIFGPTPRTKIIVDTTAERHMTALNDVMDGYTHMGIVIHASHMDLVFNPGVREIIKASIDTRLARLAAAN